MKSRMFVGKFLNQIIERKLPFTIDRRSQLRDSSGIFRFNRNHWIPYNSRSDRDTERTFKEPGKDNFQNCNFKIILKNFEK